MRSVLRVKHSPFEGMGTTGGPREPKEVESMDCSVGRKDNDSPLPQPTTEA